MPNLVDRVQVQKLLDGRAQLIEVLPAKEYEEEHLPKARNIPLARLTQQTAAVFQRNQPLIVYCYDAQ